MPTPRAGYFLADGTKVPSVTTILSRFKESGALITWAYKRGKDGLDLYESRDRAADIGTLAHAMVEYRLTGKSVEDALLRALPEHRDKARIAYAAFEEWMRQSNVGPISAEVSMVSEQHKFGGTPDLVLRMPNGKLALGDVKTSNAVYRDYLVQVAAYGLLWNENHPDDPITEGYHIMRFSKEAPDFEHRYFAELVEAAELFLVLRTAYGMDLQLKKRAA